MSLLNISKVFVIVRRGRKNNDGAVWFGMRDILV